MRLDGQRQTLVTLYLIILIIYCWLPGQSLILYVLPKIHVNEHLGGHMYDSSTLARKSFDQVKEKYH